MARRLTVPPEIGTAAQPRRPSVDPSLLEEVSAVLAAWERAGAHTDQTLARMGETIRRFACRLDAAGIGSFVEARPEDALAFITAPVSATARLPLGGSPRAATQHARRTALRTLYRTLRQLGHPVGDPTLDVGLAPRGLLAARPLTDDEVTLCRTSTHQVGGRLAPMRQIAWALGEATAVSSEIAVVRLVDLDDPTRPHTVQLPGTRRHDPRTGVMTAWGRRVVAERARHLVAAGANPSTPLAYGGHAPSGGAKAQASVCNALRTVLDAGGLGREPDIRPSSLRHWAGRSAFDTGATIDQVARLLGHRSLDAAAEDIALAWRDTTARPGQHGRAAGGRA